MLRKVVEHVGKQKGLKVGEVVVNLLHAFADDTHIIAPSLLLHKMFTKR